MNIDLNSFDREKAIDETLAAGTVDLELPNARVVGLIRVGGTVMKTSGVVGMTGNLTGVVEIDCDRCLEPVKSPFDIELDLEFAPKQEIQGDANLELRAADLKRDEIAGGEIDLADIAREQILLDLPQQFFCKDDCRGLCEKCGTNRNFKDCDCEDDEIDPRWAALKNLN